MTLPFGDAEKTFQCFVCGLSFKTYNEFSEHIFQKHEESREYIKCPVNHCQCPVRDLRIHFRTSHPKLKIPPNMQHRVSVWYDLKNPQKKKKVMSFKSGTFYSDKNRKDMHFRSSWEEKVYKCLEKKGDVLCYDVEPFPITYFFKGEQKNYWVDLIVKFTNGAVELWEIKPSNQTANEQNQAKWTACEYLCSNRGWKFDVIVEQKIQSLINEVGGIK